MCQSLPDFGFRLLSDRMQNQTKALQLVEVPLDQEFSFGFNNIKEVKILGASLELGIWNLLSHPPDMPSTLNTQHSTPSSRHSEATADQLFPL